MPYRRCPKCKKRSINPIGLKCRYKGCGYKLPSKEEQLLAQEQKDNTPSVMGIDDKNTVEKPVSDTEIPQGQPQNELEQLKEKLHISDDEINPSTQAVNSPSGDGVQFSDDAKKGFALELYQKFFEMPYKVAARATKYDGWKLTADESREIAELFKPIGDRYMPLWMEKYGDAVIFGMTISVITSDKIMGYIDFKEAQKKKEAENAGRTTKDDSSTAQGA